MSDVEAVDAVAIIRRGPQSQYDCVAGRSRDRGSNVCGLFIATLQVEFLKLSETAQNKFCVRDMKRFMRTLRESVRIFDLRVSTDETMAITEMKNTAAAAGLEVDLIDASASMEYTCVAQLRDLFMLHSAPCVFGVTGADDEASRDGKIFGVFKAKDHFLLIDSHDRVEGVLAATFPGNDDELVARWIFQRLAPSLKLAKRFEVVVGKLKDQPPAGALGRLEAFQAEVAARVVFPAVPPEPEEVLDDLGLPGVNFEYMDEPEVVVNQIEDAASIVPDGLGDAGRVSGRPAEDCPNTSHGEGETQVRAFIELLSARDIEPPLRAMDAMAFKELLAPIVVENFDFAQILATHIVSWSPLAQLALNITCALLPSDITKGRVFHAMDCLVKANFLSHSRVKKELSLYKPGLLAYATTVEGKRGLGHFARAIEHSPNLKIAVEEIHTLVTSRAILSDRVAFDRMTELISSLPGYGTYMWQFPFVCRFSIGRVIYINRVCRFLSLYLHFFLFCKVFLFFLCLKWFFINYLHHILV